MDYEPKDPVIEERPQLKGWQALVCHACKAYTLGAAPPDCPECDGDRHIHDLSKPCVLCLEASDEALVRVAHEKLLSEVCTDPGCSCPKKHDRVVGCESEDYWP